MFDNYSQPIIGLAPMDGVTDAPFRYITNYIAKPDITFTEFVNVVGACRGSERLWQDFIFSDIERPVHAQLFGSEPEYFYHAAKIVCELGFDGVDINMGCPAKNVAERGAGAGLIKTPKLAQSIVTATKKGVEDWVSTGEITGIEPEIVTRMQEMITRRMQLSADLFKRFPFGDERRSVPVSIKTRIGYDSVIITDWIRQLAETAPSWITVHGRTLKQMYTGKADWEAIASAVDAVPHIPVLANGDVHNYADVKKILENTKAKGVLIGRATYGNPWIFSKLEEVKNTIMSGESLRSEFTPSLSERLDTLLYHARLHTEIKGERAFPQLRKHMAWYVSGIEAASEIRSQLVRTNSLSEVEKIVSRIVGQSLEPSTLGESG